VLFKTAILILLVAIASVLLAPGRAGTDVNGGLLQSLNPYRVLDTRQTYMVEPGSITPVNTRLPGGVTAVSVNITITEPQSLGFLTAWDGRNPMPLASIINATAPGETVANFAIVPINVDGIFHLYSSMRTHIVVDVMGFVAGPAYGLVQPFAYVEGAFLSIGSRGWMILDGRASFQEGVNLINSCRGAVLWWGEFNTTAIIGAHRTACGSNGFGGIESLPYGSRITITINGEGKHYELFWHLDGVPRVQMEGEPIPYGTSIILQTSQDADHVYFRYFRLV